MTSAKLCGRSGCMTTTPRFDPFAYNRAVRGSQLPAIARHVAMTLATYAGKAGDAYPSVETLADGTGWKRRTVIDALNALETAGWLTRVKRGQKGRSTLYRLHASGSPTLPAGAPMCASPRSVVQDSADDAAVTCTPTPQGEQTQITPTGSALAQPAEVPDELWHVAEPVLARLLGALPQHDAGRFASAWPLAKSRNFCWMLTDLTGTNPLAKPRDDVRAPEQLIEELTSIPLDDVLHVGPALYSRLLRIVDGLPAVPPPEDPRTRVRDDWTAPPGPVGNLVAELATKLAFRTAVHEAT
jgi:hypothetical protein